MHSKADILHQPDRPVDAGGVPSPLVSCKLCAAVIHPASWREHAAWHDSLDDFAGAVADAARRTLELLQ